MQICGFYFSLFPSLLHLKVAFYDITPELQLFLAQIKDKQMPLNAPPKIFKKVDTFLVKILKPSIGQKAS